MSEQNPYMPATVPQQLALDCEADLLLFGGSAGSLKSHTLLLDAMQEREHPGFRGIIFRRTYGELTEVVDKCFRLYKPLGCEYNDQKKVWTWPSGASLRLGYMEADRDVWRYWGQEMSFMGFDESTMHTEFQIRTILSRLRTTQRGLKVRARLATNPGGMGASFQQQIFLNGACPVHEPEKCAVPGKLYTGRVWPSDGKLIPFTCAFIPGKLSDHNLLGEKYVEQLQMQSGSLADQLAMGCWCSLQGSYFGNWNRERMVLPYALIHEEYWYTYFISIDYGFGKSWAAAGLYVRVPPTNGFPQGRIFKISELAVPNVPASEFAQMVVDRFVLPLIQGQKRNIQTVYIDPANFNKEYDLRKGTGGHSVADQINEVLAPHGLGCTPASNDRIGGWQLLYKVLSSGFFAIADNCKMTAESIRTRIHAENKPGDVEKIPGDNLDDVADETRYALYTFTRNPEKPLELRIAERMALAPDATTAMITRAKLVAEVQQEKAPIFVGGRAKFKQKMFQQSLRRR